MKKVSDVNWDTWSPKETATLMFIFKNKKILLIHKKRGLGAGYYNAPGGRLEKDETTEECAIRETQEELCITPLNPSHAGTLMFQFIDGHSIHGEVYTATEFEGDPKETDEAIPIWFPEDALPYHNMWADDSIWCPKMLAGEKFIGRFIFNGKMLLDHELTLIN
ncbi:MAG: 8-oxo-dGTP diphosphatase [Flavobacteriales bacterium]|nr:8-oxo-dGTP diphosphatase [Flavobacteriales bacterium]